MVQPILVPLDGSPIAEQAAAVAARIARATGGALHLVHVHTASSVDPISIPGLPVVDEELHSLAAEHEQVYLKQVAERVTVPGFAPIVSRLEGPVVQTLTSYARDIGAGLIVLTTHGRSGFAHLWLGSVAEALVRVTTTPVLLLRPGEDGVVADRPFRQVLVPLDGSPLAEEILPHAVALARLDGGTLTLLRVIATLRIPASMPFHEHFHVDEQTIAHEHAEAEGYLRAVADKLAPVPTQLRVHEAEYPARAIIELAETLGADLVAITTHGRGAVIRAPLSSVSDKVLRGLHGPLLVVRPGQERAD